MQKAFTLVELLIVIGVIGILMTMLFVPYSNFLKSSRDARRITDLEQIRAALELYRGDNSYYPETVDILTQPGPGGKTYLEKLPKDPIENTTHKYVYTAQPDSCNNGGGTFCSEYLLGANKENGPTGVPDYCQCTSTGGVNCSYCVGPYGEK